MPTIQQSQPSQSLLLTNTNTPFITQPVQTSDLLLGPTQATYTTPMSSHQPLFDSTTPLPHADLLLGTQQPQHIENSALVPCMAQQPLYNLAPQLQNTTHISRPIFHYTQPTQSLQTLTQPPMHLALPQQTLTPPSLDLTIPQQTITQPPMHLALPQQTITQPSLAYEQQRNN
jgi:hypothetical protein